MYWTDGISNALKYIEEHLKEDIKIVDVANEAYVSSFYFQKAFRILCGFSVAEYIRYRRLSLAGSEVITTNKKIIEIALEYGYDSPDSFTKAFTRFHGVTPTVARKEQLMIKSFAPLKIQFTLKGGSTMDYKIIEKEAFTVLGKARRFDFDCAFNEIPKFWGEHMQSADKKVCGVYGVCIEDEKDEGFKYLIADEYVLDSEIPDGYEVCEIPQLTWAVFACHGAVPKSLQEVNTKIFSEWLPNNDTYEVAEHYNIEMYTPCEDYPRGNHDENYYSEIWIPIKKK